MIQLVVKNAEDRRTMVAILAENGYAVKMDRVKIDNTPKSVVVILEEPKKKGG
jgi:hypothetical protein